MKVVLIISLLILSAFCKIEFVSELVRHGARSPGVVYNFAKHPKQNFKRPMELSAIGMRQHYLIGAEFRHRYIDEAKLISEKFNSTEIHLKSTDTERTIDSGLSQMVGIFPPEVCQQTLNSWQQTHALPPMKIDGADKIIKKLKEKALPDCINLLPITSEKGQFSFDMQIENVYCPPFKQVVQELTDSDEYKQMFKEVNDPMKARFTEFLQREVEYEEIWDLCEYLTLADLHKIQLIFDYTEEDVQGCKKVHDVKYYTTAWGDERLWKYSAKVYLDNLVQSMDSIIAGNQTYKAELNFGHDDSLAYILNGLGNLTKETPELASTLFVELHSSEGKYFVRAFHDDVQMTFGLCEQLDCPYETFKKNVQQRVAPGTIEEACGTQERESIIEEKSYVGVSKLIKR